VIQILTLIWYVSFALLLGYHLYVFRSRKNQPVVHQWPELPGVSIVIAVKNGSENLIKNINAFITQEYPLFEIIIVNDHSSPQEKSKLEEIVKRFPQVTLYHSTDQPGKKQALTLGIDKAKHDLILCTDADCTPAGNGWIKSMVEHSSGDELVLGYSPYVQSKGVLNYFIRFETVMTGIQYLSWAMVGRPYMGVGRNMLYPRKLFLKENPYKNQKHIPYGDDDLWVQQASMSGNVAINIDKASHVFSTAATSLHEWVNQKHRHLSAGHYYKKNVWWQPGLYGLALILHWFLLPFLIPFPFDGLIFIFLVLGLAIRWDTYRRWTYKLGDRDTDLWYPILEVGYALYLAGMGVITLVNKKKTWN
jgi:biofilm PGA synthesis N-glycosyltransferase PgaC